MGTVVAIVVGTGVGAGVGTVVAIVVGTGVGPISGPDSPDELSNIEFTKDQKSSWMDPEVSITFPLSGGLAVSSGVGIWEGVTAGVGVPEIVNTGVWVADVAVTGGE